MNRPKTVVILNKSGDIVLCAYAQSIGYDRHHKQFIAKNPIIFRHDGSATITGEATWTKKHELFRFEET
jgi:hypothetical protein